MIDRIPNARRAADRRVWLIAIPICLFALAAFAQPRDARALFTEGRAAFERQDYANALSFFEAAIAARLDGPAVHYNMGVAAFRLQQYDKAQAAFREAARTPSMAALAHYNLGLIARAEHDERAAKVEFNRALQFAQDERVRALARTQLKLPTSPPRPKTWAAFASAGIGYDDNVALMPEGSSLGFAREADVYSDVLMVASLRAASAWRVDGDLNYLNFADLDSFDQIGLGASARYRFEIADWQTDVGVRLALTFVDQHRVELRQSQFIQASRSLSQAWSIRSRYRLSLIDGTAQYEGLDGVRHDLSARVLYAASNWGTSLGYFFEVADHDARSLSAIRHQLLADAVYSLATFWNLRGSLSYRRSEYDDSAAGSENRLELMAAAERSVGERWTFVMQYFVTDSAASTPQYDYQRNRLFIGMETSF